MCREKVEDSAQGIGEDDVRKRTSKYDKDRTCEREKPMCREKVEDSVQGTGEDDVRKKDKQI